jgi:hypothetical protein
MQRIWATVLVVVVPAAIGEVVYLALIAPQSGGGDATAELLVGGAVAGVLALGASLIFLRSEFKSLIHAAVTAALVYPLWYVVAIGDCLLGSCGYS